MHVLDVGLDLCHALMPWYVKFLIQVSPTDLCTTRNISKKKIVKHYKNMKKLEKNIYKLFTFVQSFGIKCNSKVLESNDIYCTQITQYIVHSTSSHAFEKKNSKTL